MTAVAERDPHTTAEQAGHAERPEFAEPPARRWRALAAIGVPTAVATAHASFYGAWIEDDAGITFAYARSLATGAGPVLQAGMPGVAPVEGFSDPLWLGLLVVGHWLGLFDHGAWFGTGVADLVWFPKLLGLLCVAGVFACFYVAAKAVTRRPALVAGGAGVVTACVPPFVIWCVSGLENGLFALLVVGLATVLVRAAVDGRLLDGTTATRVGLLAAGAALTRPDGMIYVLAYPAAVLAARTAAPHADRLWLLARSVVAFAIPTFAYLLLRLAVFGDWLPATARAKAQGVPDAGALNQPAEIVFYLGWALTLVVAVVVVLALTRAGHTPRAAMLALLVPLALAVVAYGVLDPDWMGWLRFATPVWPLLALLGALALAELLRHLELRPRVLVAAVLAGALALSLAMWAPNAALFRSDPVFAMCRWAVQGQSEILNGVADRLDVPAGQGSFVGTDAGGVALTSRLRYIDAFGLTDASIARWRQHGDNAAIRDYVLDAQRPTFYLIYTDWDESWKGREGPKLRDDPRFARDYVQVWSAYSGSPRTGIWVRREAISDARALAAAQEYAAGTRAVHAEMYAAPSAQVGWSCGPVLRPGSSFPAQ